MKDTQCSKSTLVDLAVEGNAQALEELLSDVQDMVFNLSLRMLGMVADAEDASQDILVRVMTNLGTFKKESEFHTWVYRIAANYLINYKKSMFSHQPLDFEFYGNDIKYAVADQTDSIVEEGHQELAEELKMSCTNVMLQCLDAKSRCIFILGTMFRIDSHTAGDILEMSAENYRQKLSRIRAKVAAFLAEYCGLSGTGMCSCKKRVEYAVKQKRLNPKQLEYIKLHPLEKRVLEEVKGEMEKLDELSLVFDELPMYQTPETIRDRMELVLHSAQMKKIQEF